MINTQRKDTLQILRDSFGLDLGVDPDKSTPVDLRIWSRVGSILLGAVDRPSNLKRKVTFALLSCKSTWTDLKA